jgi:hypothetical protein
MATTATIMGRCRLLDYLLDAWQAGQVTDHLPDAWQPDK